jgi:hypothetical protein
MIMKIKPMSIILIGAIVTIIGGTVTAIGTYFQNKASSKRMQSIQSTSEQQLQEIGKLQTQNNSLKTTVEDLNVKASEQQKTILDLTKQNTQLSLQLAQSTEKLYGNLTGGDAYLELIITPISTNQADLYLLSHGDFPLYDITLQITSVDMARNPKNISHDDWQKIRVSINAGNLHQRSAMPLGKFSSDFSKGKKDFTIQFSARNGHFSQKLLMFKLNDSWEKSVIITNMLNNKILYEMHDTGIPKELLSEK